VELAVVRDLWQRRAPSTPEELAAFETDVLAGFVLARASAGLADATIRGDVGNLEQIRAWFGQPLWEMQPTDADAYFGRVLRAAAGGTRRARAQALVTYFRFLELRHQIELHVLTGRVVTCCPIDAMNRPRGVPSLKSERAAGVGGAPARRDADVESTTHDGRTDGRSGDRIWQIEVVVSRTWRRDPSNGGSEFLLADATHNLTVITSIIYLCRTRCAMGLSVGIGREVTKSSMLLSG
jgi:hypothetical protein